MNWSHATSALIVVGGCLALVRANMKLTDRVSRLDSYVRMFNAMMHVDSGDYPPRLAREDGSRNTTGLKVGDIIESTHGEEIIGLPGTPLTLEIRRGTEHLTINAVRTKVCY